MKVLYLILLGLSVFNFIAAVVHQDGFGLFLAVLSGGMWIAIMMAESQERK